jgi:hypothetical protein
MRTKLILCGGLKDDSSLMADEELASAGRFGAMGL